MLDSAFGKGQTCLYISIYRLENQVLENNPTEKHLQVLAELNESVVSPGSQEDQLHPQVHQRKVLLSGQGK